MFNIDAEKIYDGNNFEIDSKDIEIITLAPGDTLSGKLIYNKKDAGVYSKLNALDFGF